jgi:hypothetical protein
MLTAKKLPTQDNSSRSVALVNVTVVSRLLVTRLIFFWANRLSYGYAIQEDDSDLSWIDPWGEFLTSAS